MSEHEEQRRAAEALATVRQHQERTRRAARLPWWVFAGMFVLIAGVTAVNDFVTLSGAKLVAALVLVLLAVVLVLRSVGRTSLLGRVRGIEARQSVDPRTLGVVVVVAAVGTWLIPRYSAAVAGAVGLPDYPNTVCGVLFGAVFTALYALYQLRSAAHRRGDR